MTAVDILEELKNEEVKRLNQSPGDVLLSVLHKTQMEIFSENKADAQLLKRALINRLQTASNDKRLRVIVEDTSEPIRCDRSENDEIVVLIHKDLFLRMKTSVDRDVQSEFNPEIDGPLIIRVLQNS